MRRIGFLMVAVLLAVALIVIPITAQSIPPLAAVMDNQLVIFGSGGPQVVMNSGGAAITNLVWSPDGQYLAFTIASEAPQLLLTDRSGSSPRTIAQPASSLPATFSTDSQQIVYGVADYAATTTSAAGFPEVPVIIFAQPVNDGSSRVQLAQISFGIGCGGGSPYPMDAIYNREAGFGGRALIFDYTSSGLLHSINCAGLGIAMHDLETDQQLWVSTDAAKPTLSPDNTRIAAVVNGSIALFDATTGAQQIIQTQYSPDQIAWSDSATIFYSVRSLMNTPLPVSGEEAAALDAVGYNGNNIPQFALSIHRLSVNGGEQAILQTPGWAIGRIIGARGNFYFSVVPNGEAWVEALTSSDLSTAFNAVTVTLFQWTGSDMIELGDNIAQAAVNPAG